MVAAVIAVFIKMNILSVALVERLLVALALVRRRFEVGNAPSFNDLQEG